MSQKDEPMSERSESAITKENIDRVLNMVMDNWQLTIDQIANAISVSCERFENILQNKLGMMIVNAPLLPSLLTSDRMHIMSIISRENMILFEPNPAGLLERFPIKEECRLRHFVSETKKQSMQRAQPLSCSKVAGKETATIFFFNAKDLCLSAVYKRATPSV